MKKILFIPVILLFSLLASCQNNPAPVHKEKESSQKMELKVKTMDMKPKDVKIPVLMYHSINQKVTNNLIIPPKEFNAQMKWLKTSGFHTISLADLAKMLKTGKQIPEKPIVITFDDGYQDNYTNAYPILQKYHFKANIFVITDKIGAANHFNAIEMKEMSENGIEMDSHTVHHQELNKMPYHEQLKELQDSKAKITEITGKPVNSICYPVGRFNEETKKAAAAAGYEMGFTTHHGYANQSKGFYTLPRIRMYPGVKMEQILK